MGSTSGVLPFTVQFVWRTPNPTLPRHLHHPPPPPLLLRSNQRPLADATPQPPCLPAGVRCGRGRGFGARSCAPGGEHFAGIIGGLHHNAGVLLVVRGQSKWQPGREDQRAGRGERQSWRDELRAGCRGGGTRTRRAQAERGDERWGGRGDEWRRAGRAAGGRLDEQQAGRAAAGARRGDEPGGRAWARARPMGVKISRAASARSVIIGSETTPSSSITPSIVTRSRPPTCSGARSSASVVQSLGTTKPIRGCPPNNTRTRIPTTTSPG